jgi:hypothetical protein
MNKVAIISSTNATNINFLILFLLAGSEATKAPTRGIADIRLKMIDLRRRRDRKILVVFANEISRESYKDIIAD